MIDDICLLTLVKHILFRWIDKLLSLNIQMDFSPPGYRVLESALALNEFKVKFHQNWEYWH